MRVWVRSLSMAALTVGIAVFPATTSATVAPRPLTGIHVTDGRILDDLGRTVVLRGINVVDKSGWTGALSDPMLDEGLLEVLTELGFNHLRFGTTWASIEHERGVFDEAYIDQFLDQLDLLAGHGLLAVVDMHQDVWGGALGFDGAPTWADPQCNVPPDGDFDEPTGNFFAEYASPAVNAAWANFWNDGYGQADPHCTGPVQTEFVEMWRHFAARLDDHPAIAGYDMLNEPWPSAPPGVFEEGQLFPMYRRVAAAIAESDPDTPVFFGPPLYSPAVPTVSVGPPVPDSVFAPHIYSETYFSGGNANSDAATDEVALAKDVEDAERMGVPLWIGEWGAIDIPSYTRASYDLYDRYRVGSAFWFNIQLPGDSFPEDARPEHRRAYPEAYPGEATWSYDAAGRVLTVTVTVDEAQPAPVQLVTPAGLCLTTDDDAVTFAPELHRSTWTLPGPGDHTLTLVGDDCPTAPQIAPPPSAAEPAPEGLPATGGGLAGPGIALMVTSRWIRRRRATPRRRTQAARGDEPGLRERVDPLGAGGPGGR